jgi:hypothetical protein
MTHAPLVRLAGQANSSRQRESAPDVSLGKCSRAGQRLLSTSDDPLVRSVELG